MNALRLLSKDHTSDVPLDFPLANSFSIMLGVMKSKTAARTARLTKDCVIKTDKI